MLIITDIDYLLIPILFSSWCWLVPYSWKTVTKNKKTVRYFKNRELRNTTKVLIPACLPFTGVRMCLYLLISAIFRKIQASQVRFYCPWLKAVSNKKNWLVVWKSSGNICLSNCFRLKSLLVVWFIRDGTSFLVFTYLVFLIAICSFTVTLPSLGNGQRHRTILFKIQCRMGNIQKWWKIN